MQKKGRLQEDDFSFKMVSMEEFMKVVLKLNSKIYIYIYAPRMEVFLQVS